MNQLGVGKFGYSIEGYEEEWDDFLREDEKDLSLKDIIMYVGIKVRMIFDPPTSSQVSKSLSEILKETEFRIMIDGDKTF